jgi:sortase (surface protein transpeptidase)
MVWVRSGSARVIALGIAVAVVVSVSGVLIAPSLRAVLLGRSSVSAIRPTPASMPTPSLNPALDVTPSPLASGGPSPSPSSSQAPRAALPVFPTPARGAVVPAWLIIPKIGTDAPVVREALTSQGAAPAPPGPFVVAWYTSSAMPGAGSNAVFAGHLDYARVGNPAVFWRLGQLVPGDQIQVRSAGGAFLWYRVEWSRYYTFANAPLGEITGATAGDAITLYTCAGTYSTGGGYDHRLVVRAVRVPA